MRTLLALTAFLLIGFTPQSLAAQGQVMCGKRGDVIAKLENKFSETRVSIGLANSGAVIEVYASKAGTFTVLVTRPDGRTCLVAAGEHWENLKPRRLTGFNS
jgi:hypothetical protein